MKRNIPLPFIIIISVIFATIFMAGCVAGEDGTLDEPDITVEYLAGEYAAQLVRDGATAIFGSINIAEDEEGTIFVDVVEKEYVVEPTMPNGFYIAYKNLESTYQLAYEARATFLRGGESAAQAMDAGEFVNAVLSDFDEFGGGDPGYMESKHYDIYIMGDMIQLLIARYVP